MASRINKIRCSSSLLDSLSALSFDSSILSAALLYSAVRGDPGIPECLSHELMIVFTLRDVLGTKLNHHELYRAQEGLDTINFLVHLFFD